MPSLRLPGPRDLPTLLLSFAFCLSILQSLRTRPAPRATKAGGTRARERGRWDSAGAGGRAGGRGSPGGAVPPAAPGSRAPPQSPAASREGRPGEFRRLLSIVACRNKKCNCKHFLRAELKNRSLLSVFATVRSSTSPSFPRRPRTVTWNPGRHNPPHKSSSDPNLQPPPAPRPATTLLWGPLEPQSTANRWVLSLFSACRLHPRCPQTGRRPILTAPSREAVNFPTQPCRSGRSG